MNLFSVVCEWYVIVDVVAPDLNESDQAPVVPKVDSVIQLSNIKGQFCNTVIICSFRQSLSQTIISV